MGDTGQDGGRTGWDGATRGGEGREGEGRGGPGVGSHVFMKYYPKTNAPAMHDPHN